MEETPPDEAPSEPAHPWEQVRRLREPVAWVLLALVVIGMLFGVASLLGLRGTVPVDSFAGGSGPAPGLPFGVRAYTAAPTFVDLGNFVLKVLALILVVFAGGRTARAREVVQTIAVIQVVDLGFGILCWIGVLGSQSVPNLWFIEYVRDLAVGVVVLVFVMAVLRSPALRPSPVQFADDNDEDFEDEDDYDFTPHDGDFGGEEEVDL
ncbi:MAG TPA: hypothetical protein VGI58_07420 [Streptosporangiaceae bacterium]